MQAKGIIAPLPNMSIGNLDKLKINIVDSCKQETKTMPLSDMQESDSATPSNSLPSSSQESYQIIITVSQDGFTVDDSEPLPDLATALKHVIAIVQERPVSGDAHDELKAGYNSA
jgi:hypothetical protein